METTERANGKKKIEVLDAQPSKPMKIEATPKEAQEIRALEEAAVKAKLAMADAAAEVLAHEDALDVARKKLRRVQDNAIEIVNAYKARIESAAKDHGIDPQNNSWQYVNESAEFIRR